ncbi:hypothetical protein F5X68DRAFT_200747 [Plectosphaerella plurivora]|uniref:Uncharacterized protein n=1 Tax=Plectosphaerella plurivora TaxID=936078 RepID=A0A9P8VIJ4_9PEZI|nr:hypothetical protein F5X68DRAFT_200747 [Plectosphaerella plurivora]
MPPGINHAAIASAGAIAVSVAVAAAIAIYESPELRRNIDELRRRVAVALHSMGENIDPAERVPRFNRPEDAQGFLESRRSAEPGVEADEESRRRQRDELMYWNAIHMEKMNRLQLEQGDSTQSESPAALPAPTRGKSFDDFLQKDKSGEEGSFVVHSGTDVRQGEENVRRRGVTPAMYTNPFADEHQIDQDELHEIPKKTSNDVPKHRDNASDIYSATTYDPEEARRILATIAPAAAIGGAAAATAALVDIQSDNSTEKSVTMDRELGDEEYMTAGQDDRAAQEEAYASIQAWAQGSTATDFYSPLPMSPTSAAMSEPEIVSEGALTPTDSISVIGHDDAAPADATPSSPVQHNNDRPFDVLSESDGMMTPASWSEVGSVVSESDSPQRVHAI